MIALSDPADFTIMASRRSEAARLPPLTHGWYRLE